MKNNKLEIIGTLNTHKMSEKMLKQLVDKGVSILRLNGAHVEVENVIDIVRIIRKATNSDVKVLLDLPGNKIRTKNIYAPIHLKTGESFKLKKSNFNHKVFVEYLEKDDIVLSSDGQLEMVVKDISKDTVLLTALCEGELLNNKGVHLQADRINDMPLLFDYDFQLIEEAKKANVDYIGFSFVRTRENVIQAKQFLEGTDIKPIIKIETFEATKENNLKEIMKLNDIFLIDRGDLASEVGLVNFPKIFNCVLDELLKSNKDVFVATQIFASMYNHNLPYLSELMETDRLISKDIKGLQLSDEIAVGKYPMEVLELISNLVKERL